MASAISPIATKPSSVAAQTPAGWQDAVNNTYNHGAETQLDGYPLTRGLQDIDAPTTGTHHADYMNLWGGKDPKGRFVADQVTLVSEDWQLGTDDKFHIDQWLYAANLDGSGVRATHGFLVEDKEGQVFDSGNYNLTDADSAAKLGGLIGKWAKFQPKAHTSVSMLGQPEVERDAGVKHVAASMTANGFALAAPTAKGVKLR